MCKKIIVEEKDEYLFGSFFVDVGENVNGFVLGDIIVRELFLF